MLQYFMPVRAGTGDTYSIDKLILDFKLRGGRQWTDSFFSYLNQGLSIYFRHWTTNRIGAHKEQFTFDCGDGNSFWCGVGLNDGTGNVSNRVRLEFNPNKVAAHYEFIQVFNCLRSLAVGPPGVVRFDLAVDFPVLRSDCWLLKDNRMYEEVRKSSEDRTQYLGERNKPGRCKLYNKALEAGLGYPLSRLEITLSGETIDYKDLLGIWPQVLILDDLQLVFDGLKLTETDRFIVRSLILDAGRIAELSRRKRQKIAGIMTQYIRFLEIDKAAYEDILSQLYIYSQQLAYWGG